MIFSRTDRVQIEQDNFCPLGLTLCRDGQIERGADELRKALALKPRRSGRRESLGNDSGAMNKTTGRRKLRRDMPEVSPIAKSLTCVMLMPL
jgi:hypothetical protein